MCLGGETAAMEADPAAQQALRMAMTANSSAARSANSNRSKRGKDSKTSEKRRVDEQGNEQIINVNFT